MNADGGDQQRLTNHPSEDVCPAWSPDGTRLVYLTSRHDPNPTGCSPNCHYEIYLMDADGSQEQRLTETEATELHAAWSPDGTEIVFASERDGNQEVYVMNADGSDARRLTNDPAADMHPVWSPDGSVIAFNSDRDGSWDIYLMDVANGPLTRLTDGPEWHLFPDWSPDGTEIAFFSMVQGSRRQDIFVINADGTELRQLTDSPTTVDEDPAWSPDGSQIAFQSNRDGNYEIYVMNRDGSEQQPLTRAGSDEYWPDWRTEPRDSP